MKRSIFGLFFSLFLACSVFAYTDSFTSMTQDEDFLSLMYVLKNGKSSDEAESAYRMYINKDISTPERSRTEYHMVRYFMDKGDKEKAIEHLERERKAYEEISPGATEIEKRTAEADLVSADYYISGKMGKGMESSKLTKALYKDYPDEFYAALQEAFRLLYTPPIAGGSVKKAASIINDIEKNKDGISLPDYYSLLIAKAMALSKTGEYDESDEYLKKAAELYTFDPAIEEIRRDNERGRRAR